MNHPHPDFLDRDSINHLATEADALIAQTQRVQALPRKHSPMTAKAKPAKATPEQIGSRAINEGRARVLRSPRVRTFTAPKS